MTDTAPGIGASDDDGQDDTAGLADTDGQGDAPEPSRVKTGTVAPAEDIDAAEVGPDRVQTTITAKD